MINQHDQEILKKHRFLICKISVMGKRKAAEIGENEQPAREKVAERENQPAEKRLRFEH